MKVTLAFYKGQRSENDHALLFDRLVCWRTASRFSHVELVLEEMPGGRARCASSSLRDGGVRVKEIDLRTGRWVLATVEGDIDDARDWFRRHDGLPYDWFSLLGWVLPWRVSFWRWWFCSEAVAESLGRPRSWRISPDDLFKTAEVGLE